VLDRLGIEAPASDSTTPALPEGDDLLPPTSDGPALPPKLE
jgi:hypothetical protein